MLCTYFFKACFLFLKSICFSNFLPGQFFEVIYCVTCLELVKGELHQLGINPMAWLLTKWALGIKDSLFWLLYRAEVVLQNDGIHWKQEGQAACFYDWSLGDKGKEQSFTAQEVSSFIIAGRRRGGWQYGSEHSGSQWVRRWACVFSRGWIK